MNLSTPIVIDNGSGVCKAGFSGQDGPKTAFPAIIGYPKYEMVMPGMSIKQCYVGQQAISKKGILKLEYPIQHGIIKDWQAMSNVWSNCFYNQLRVNPQQHPCLLTQAPRNPKQNRERMAQTMFQTFSIPKFYLSIQAVLSLYSSGRTTGLVVDAGDGVTHTVPVFEGYSLPHAVERMDLAGRDLTEYMRKIMTEVGRTFTSSSEFQIIRQIKQKHCYVAQNYQDELKKYDISKQKIITYELPDGSLIPISSQQFRCPQALFQPSFLGKDMKGIHQLAYSSIIQSDVDIRKQLYESIILSGGTTMFSGISQRLRNQIQKLAPSAMKVKILAEKERKYAVWIGGAILTGLSTFQNNWITKAEYDQYGASIVHKKCF